MVSIALESTDPKVWRFGSIAMGLTGRSMAVDCMEPTDPSGVFSRMMPICIEAFAARPSDPLGCSCAIPGVREDDVREDVSVLDLDEALGLMRESSSEFWSVPSCVESIGVLDVGSVESNRALAKFGTPMKVLRVTSVGLRSTSEEESVAADAVLIGSAADVACKVLMNWRMTDFHSLSLRPGLGLLLGSGIKPGI